MSDWYMDTDSVKRDINSLYGARINNASEVYHIVVESTYDYLFNLAYHRYKHGQSVESGLNAVRYFLEIAGVVWICDDILGLFDAVTSDAYNLYAFKEEATYTLSEVDCCGKFIRSHKMTMKFCKPDFERLVDRYYKARSEEC